MAERGENLKAHSPCLGQRNSDDSLQIPQGTVGLTACLLPPHPHWFFFLEPLAHKSLAWGLLWGLTTDGMLLFFHLL